MNASDLIKILQELVKKHGDKEVVILSELSILDIEDVVPQDHGTWFAMTVKDPD